MLVKLGQMELEHFEGLTSMPNEFASAWHIMEGLVGATYKPLLCLGSQLVNGKNFFFIAEQTIVTNPAIRRVVKVVINKSAGHYELIGVEEV